MIRLLIHFIVILLDRCILLELLLLLLYIFGGRVKNLMFYKMCEKKIHFCLVGDFPMTYQIKGGKWVI